MTVARRPETPADDVFLRQLLRRAVGDELGVWSWPEALRESMLEQQSSIRRQAARSAGPGRSSEIIEADGAPAGWICLVDTGEAIRIADIVVAPEYQGKGIGATVVNAVVRDAGGRPVRLNVTAANTRAAAFYQRLGFERTGGDEVQHFLERRAC